MSDAGFALDLVDRAGGDHLAAVAAGAGAEVDEVVGGAHRLLVVLDDDDRVAEVAQLAERREQPRVVALVQPDARLVEDVEHADEARADLRREPDALRLAAGERLGAAAEREVVEADVDEEAQAVAHFLQDGAGDLGVESGASLRAQRHGVEEDARLGDRELDELADVPPVHRDRERLRLEAAAAAARSRAPAIMYSCSSVRTASELVSV